MGDLVRSKVSGFSGIVTAVCHYLYGPITYAVTRDVIVDGETKTEWFNQAELESAE